MSEARHFWDDLFGPTQGAANGRRLPMRLLRKGGRPFLLLPPQSAAAAAALELYPAQTPRARLAKAGLRALLRAGLALGTTPLSLTFVGEAPFPKFLCGLSGAGLAEPPCFGVLAGNPAMASQRFLVLLFGSSQEPRLVVKAGCNPAAVALIHKEAAFLAGAADKSAAIPRLHERFESNRISALALNYVAGRSPRPAEERVLPELLSSWVDEKRTTTLALVPDWGRLEQAGAANPVFGALAKTLRARQFHPALHHGDFAPWNIKVSAQGTWTVLDWERGELCGLPGWDWFHYVVQSGILVQRQSIPVLMGRLEALLHSPSFRDYAHRAGITGLEQALLLAYLLHCVEVIRPAEGLAATRELLSALAARWPGPAS